MTGRNFPNVILKQFACSGQCPRSSLPRTPPAACEYLCGNGTKQARLLVRWHPIGRAYRVCRALFGAAFPRGKAAPKSAAKLAALLGLRREPLQEEIARLSIEDKDTGLCRHRRSLRGRPGRERDDICGAERPLDLDVADQRAIRAADGLSVQQRAGRPSGGEQDLVDPAAARPGGFEEGVATEIAFDIGGAESCDGAIRCARDRDDGRDARRCKAADKMRGGHAQTTG